MAKSLLDPTKSPILKEIRERHEYAKREWSKIREEAAKDMRFVSGNPWDDDDLDDRDGRPTIAPEEMSQYRNQVTNALRANPRGAKFQPAGGGSSKQSAEFYQDKWREIEYRSHAVEAYIAGAENALQRSYGYWRVKTEYQSPRSPNQELVIEAFPDPDVVLPDPDAKRRTSEDMKYCFVLETMPQAEFKRKYKTAKVTNFSDYLGRYKNWVVDSKNVQVGEYWSVETRLRKLFAVALSTRDPQTGAEVLADKPLFVFDDELPAIQKQASRGIIVRSSREVRDVDYPQVKQRITNGLEVLEELDWKGKYIPIVSVYGPILYVPDGGTTNKVILSMTRFGRDPWKAFCYACSQELEVLGMVPHGSVVAHEGQLAGHEDDWEESLHKPKLVLYYKGRVPGMTAEDERLEKPTRLEYTQGEYLQAIEMVKEGFRRSIQAAMGSNFLPTQAQKQNEKSGEALDKMLSAATQGTYHFVDAYEDAVRQTAVIGEDLLDKTHDYTGDTAVMNGKQEAKSVPINDPQNPDAVSTRGDHLVTISTAPSSDSEYDAVQEFLTHFLQNLEQIAQLAGPQVALALLAHSIKMKNMGPMGDELANMLMPPDMQADGDGKPPDPRLMQAKQQIQQMQQKLQELGYKIQTKQVEGQTKFAIEKYKTDAKSDDSAKNREVKLAVAELGDRVDRLFLMIEESKLVGARAEGRVGRAHDAIERAKDRAHEIHASDRAALQDGVAAAADSADEDAAAVRDGQIASQQIDQQAGHAAAQQERAAALAPTPEGGQ